MTTLIIYILYALLSVLLFHVKKFFFNTPLFFFLKNMTHTKNDRERERYHVTKQKNKICLGNYSIVIYLFDDIPALF
jgi:hypothetical protein